MIRRLECRISKLRFRLLLLLLRNLEWSLLSVTLTVHYLISDLILLLIVSDPPKILSVGPDRLTTAPLFTSATFECIGEGNPQPTYQWLQRYPTPSDFIIERGRESKLHIPNVTYDYQGEYVCKVTNIIGGTERTVQSEAIALQVVGKFIVVY